MRKLLIALSAIAAVGIALPAMSGTAQAEKVVIKTNHGHHYGWRNHHRHATRVVIKRGHRHHY